MWNTGYKGYNRRRRKINGIPDGFVEDNNNSGVGPYIAPVIDLVSCPTTSSTTSTTTTSTTSTTTSTTSTSTTTSSTTSTTTTSTSTTTTTLAPVYIWVEDTFSCEQTTPFQEVSQVTGFSSPVALYWDETSARFITVDVDDRNGNVYTFDPDTLTSYGDRSVAPGILDNILTYDYDSVERKLWVAGDNTDGAKVYDVATNTTTTVNYGTNTAYGRVIIRILGDIVYANNATNSNLPSDMYLIDKNTLVVTTKLNASIPSGGTYFYKAFGIQAVNGNEIWCYAQQRFSGKIAVYDITLSTLIAEIDIPGAAAIGGWGFSQCWQGHYYDEEKNRWYAHDMGSNRWHVIDTINRTVIHTTPMDNRQGKSYGSFGFIRNPLTGDLYISGSYIMSASDSSPIRATYKINRDTYEYEYLYTATSFSALTLREGTNEVWGAYGGNVYSQTGTNWDTDGIITKNLA